MKPKLIVAALGGVVVTSALLLAATMPTSAAPQAPAAPPKPVPTHLSNAQKSVPGHPEAEHHEVAKTLKQVRAQFNPHNDKSIRVTENPNGTFKVEEMYLVDPNAVPAPAPAGGYQKLDSNR